MQIVEELEGIGILRVREVIGSRIHRNPQRSLREMERNLGISHTIAKHRLQFILIGYTKATCSQANMMKKGVDDTSLGRESPPRASALHV